METEIRDRLILTRMMKNDNWSYMDAELEHVRSALADLNYGACAMGKVGDSLTGGLGMCGVPPDSNIGRGYCRARVPAGRGSNLPYRAGLLPRPAVTRVPAGPGLLPGAAAAQGA